MKIEADLERCVSSGMCALTAPRLFDQDEEDGHVLVVKEHPADEELEAARQAVALCPSAALSLTDEAA